MAWTITVSGEEVPLRVLARDGLRRIVQEGTTASCSNFAKDAPRGDGQCAVQGPLTTEACEQIWTDAKMDTPVKAPKSHATGRRQRYAVRW